MKTILKRHFFTALILALSCSLSAFADKNEQVIPGFHLYPFRLQYRQEHQLNDPVTNAVTANYPSLSRIRYTVPDLAPREICSHPPRNRTLMIAVSASGLLFGTGYAMFCGYTAWEGIGHPATAYETQKSFIGVSQGMIIAGISSLFLKFFLDQINECQNDSITSPE